MGRCQGTGPAHRVHDHWDAQNARMINNYFPNRQAVVFSQLRAQNLYPDLDAPEFNQHGGVVAPGFEVRFSADSTLYYTTDGSDPRRPRGFVGTSAIGASDGDSLKLQTTTHLRARAFDGSEWSALNEATFIVGMPPTAATLAIGEIMYHPASGDPAGEFIELVNLSSTDGLDLTGVHFSDGVEFTFPLGFTLDPGERAVLVADQAAFAAAHPDVAIAGTYSGALNNGGERIALADSTATDFLAFTYDNNNPWPESPDGQGTSLVLIAPETAPDNSRPENWRASTTIGGNPGDSDRIPYSGGDLISYALIAHPVFDFSGMTISAALRPGADDVEVIPQWSADLQNWNEDHFDYLGGRPGQWRIVPPLPDLRSLFVRVTIAER